jgi:hypothetical protein
MESSVTGIPSCNQTCLAASTVDAIFFRVFLTKQQKSAVDHYRFNMVNDIPFDDLVIGFQIILSLSTY